MSIVAYLPRPAPVDPEASEVGSQLPPHDLESERAMLADVLLDGSPHADGTPSALEVALEQLKPEHFFDFAHGRIWQAVQALAVAKTPVDTITVGRWLNAQGWIDKIGGGAYLAQIVDATPKVGNVRAHIEAVLELHDDRELLAVAQRVAVEARRPHQAEGGREAFRARARRLLGATTRPRSQLVGASQGAIIDQVRARAEAAAQQQIPSGVEYGYEAMRGFGLIAERRQIVIAGRPGMGKTGFTFQVTRRIVEAESIQGIGEAVYWWCGEMDPVDLLSREAANHAHIHFRDVERGSLTAEQWVRYGRALDRFEKLPIWWDHEPGSPEQIATRFRHVKALFEAGKAERKDRTLFPKCRMRVCAIDQLSEMLPSDDVGPRDDERVRFGKIAKACQRLIAQKQSAATLLLCQLKRANVPPSKVEPPALHDLAESGKIEQAADKVIALHSRQYYLRGKTPDEWRNVLEVIDLKGRFGQGEDARLGFYNGRISDILPPAARGEPHYENHDDNGEDDR